MPHDRHTLIDPKGKEDGASLTDHNDGDVIFTGILDTTRAELPWSRSSVVRRS